MADRGIPVTIKELDKSWLFGLVSLSYLVEDRRPDLVDEDRAGTSYYKHYITFRVGLSKYYWSVYTESAYEHLPSIT